MTTRITADCRSVEFRCACTTRTLAREAKAWVARCRRCGFRGLIYGLPQYEPLPIGNSPCMEIREEREV